MSYKYAIPSFKSLLNGNFLMVSLFGNQADSREIV